MKRVANRDKNTTLYRASHLPIWVWVFFVLPGPLTHDLYLRGPDRRHGYWLLAVLAVSLWRGLAGRLPGVEPTPYVTHFGMEKPNITYRVACYTAAWIDLLVPFTLNLTGLAWASVTGRWMLPELYRWPYYLLSAAVVACTLLDLVPRTKRSTRGEGTERAWFYVAIWTVVPAQVVVWAVWRLGGRLGLDPLGVARFRLASFAVAAGLLLGLGVKGILPRTARYYSDGPGEGAGTPSASPVPEAE